MPLFVLVWLLCAPLTLHAAPSSSGASVIATVNGKAITLHQVEALCDSKTVSIPLASNASVELLQRQYGDCLASLIVIALMEQALERRDAPVTEQELIAAETQVYADYGQREAFVQALEEEYLDYDSWREVTRQRLVIQRFQEVVLRPRFSLKPEAFQTYYKEHAAEFETPEQLELVWLQDLEQEVLQQQRERWLKGTEAERADLLSNNKTLHIPLHRLPPKLRQAVEKLRPNEVTAVVQENDVYHFAVLCKRLPKRVLSPEEALPSIEQALAEAKWDEAYASWLHEVLPTASIRIAASLSPKNIPNTDASTKSMPPAKEDVPEASQ